MERLRGALPLVAWLGSLAAGIVLFTQLGDGPLAAPDVTDPSSWEAWAAGRDPVVAGVAVLRLLALALAWYLVGVTTIGLVARLLRLASLVRIADAMSGPLVRHVLRSALGVSLAVGVVASSAGAGPRAEARGPAEAGAPTAVAVPLDDAEDVDASDAATVRNLAHAPGGGDEEVLVAAPVPDPSEVPDGAPDVIVASPLPATGDDVVVASPLPDDADAPQDVARMVPLPPALAGPADPAAEDEVAPPATREVVDAPTPGEHEVAAGEHLWSIAEGAVAEALGRAPTDAEVHAHWRELIERNRDRLADPDNPDLLFPGQRLLLPEVAPQADA